MERMNNSSWFLFPNQRSTENLSILLASPGEQPCGRRHLLSSHDLVTPTELHTRGDSVFLHGFPKLHAISGLTLFVKIIWMFRACKLCVHLLKHVVINCMVTIKIFLHGFESPFFSDASRKSFCFSSPSSCLSSSFPEVRPSGKRPWGAGAVPAESKGSPDLKEHSHYEEKSF